MKIGILGTGHAAHLLASAWATAGHEITLGSRDPGAKQVDVEYTYHKEELLAKEAVYIAFPLNLPGARVESDSQLGWIDWDRSPRTWRRRAR